MGIEYIHIYKFSKHIFVEFKGHLLPLFIRNFYWIYRKQSEGKEQGKWGLIFCLFLELK